MNRSTSSPAVRQSRRSVIVTARYWSVLLLLLAVVAVEVLMIIRADSTAPRGGWLWPVVALAAAVGWRFARLRGAAVLLMIVQLVVLWSRVLFPSAPTTENDGRVSGLGAALQAVGAADLLRCIAAAISLLACILAIVRTRDDLRHRRSGIVAGIAAAAVLITACVPVGHGLRAFSTSRVVRTAEQSQILDAPDTAGSASVRIGTRQGWSRAKIIAAQPAGNRVVGIESGNGDENPAWHAIIGLRSTDGALLWRYRLKAAAGQDSVGPAVIDRSARMIMIRFDRTLIGLDFDGQVHYRRPLPEAVDPTQQPDLIGDVLGNSASSLQLGSVAVFGGNGVGSPAGFATGYAVATGRQLWQYTAADASCDFAQVNGPGRQVYLLTAGSTSCHTELVGYDGATTTFHRALHAPKGYVRPVSGPALDTGVADVTPSIALAGADRIVTSPLWTSADASDGDPHPQQQVTQIFDSAGGPIGTLPSGAAPRSALRLLPTPLSPGPASSLGAVVLGDHASGSDGSRDRWVTLSPQLRTTATTSIPSGSGYQRIASLLVTWPWGGVDSTGVVSLSRIGNTLQPVQKLRPGALPHCGRQISWISADDTRMAIRCGHTVLVASI